MPWMKSAFKAINEEVEMWYEGGVSEVCEDFPPFDLRPEVPTTDFGRTAFPSNVSEWGIRQLEVLRAIPLDDLPIDRVIPARFLPKSPDLAFSQLRREINLLFSPNLPASNHFHALRLALNEVHEKGWVGKRHGGEAILAGFLAAFDHQGNNFLPKHYRLGHVGRSISALKWPMGGAPSEFEARTHGHIFLESTVEGEEHLFVADPAVSQAIYTGNNPAEQVGIMLGALYQHLLAAKHYQGQEGLQITLEDHSMLRMNYIYVPEPYFYHMLAIFQIGVEPTKRLPYVNLRRSVAFDIATAEGLKGATAAMLGLRRFLMSGEARIERMQAAVDQRLRAEGRKFVSTEERDR